MSLSLQPFLKNDDVLPTENVPPLDENELEHIYKYTVNIWPQLHHASILLTGGTGFFGVWLMESLAYALKHSGCSLTIHVLTRNKQRVFRKFPHWKNYTHVIWHESDVASWQGHAGLTHCIHAAATSATAIDHSEMIHTVVDGTRHILHKLQDAPLQRLLFVSSGAVYGPQPAHLQRFPLDYVGAPSPLDPRNAYGISKRLAEYLVAEHCLRRQIPFSIGRCFAFMGPHLPLDTHFAFGNLMLDAMRGKTLRILGDGTPERSYMHAADMAINLWRLLLCGDNQAHHVGSEESVSILQLAQAIASCFHLDVEVAKQPSVHTERQRYVPERDSTIILRHIELTEGIESTYRYWKRAMEVFPQKGVLK
jgi:nucleoside-diphosphate-sugar epimerase